MTKAKGKKPNNLTPKKVGRPPTYDPAMCARALAMGTDGKSRAQIAFGLGVTRETLYQWNRTHKEFAAALKHALDAAQAWWEDQGQIGIHAGKDFNATAYIFQMKNRFRDDYADKIDVKHDASQPFLEAARLALAGHFNTKKVDRREDDDI